MQEVHPHKVTFVLGGVRSGKSRFAQRVASRFSKVVFIATAKPTDAEMRMRIERHRQNRPPQWETREVPLDLDAAISELGETDQLAIVDCLTVYLANVMGEARGVDEVIEGYLNRLCSTLTQTKSSVILVSNEVGSGVHPPTELGRRYCDFLGELNQRVAASADKVVLMVAGVPLVIKGPRPGVSQPQFSFGAGVTEVVEQSGL